MLGFCIGNTHFKLALLVHKVLHDSTAVYLVDDCQLVSPSPATIGRHGYVLCSTDQHMYGSVTGALQLLVCGFGTVCRPGFASPTTTLENFVGS